MLGVIVIVEPTARIDWEGTNLFVLGRDSENLPVGRTKIAHRTNVVAFKHWRNREQQFSLAANSEIVLVSKVVRLPGLVAAYDRRDAPGEDEHDVLPEVRQLFGLTAAKTFSQADQQEQRTHSPRNAKHSEEGAQLMRPQSRHGLAHDVK